MRAAFPIGLISVGTMSDTHLTIHPSGNINSRDRGEMYTADETGRYDGKKVLYYFLKSQNVRHTVGPAAPLYKA